MSAPVVDEQARCSGASPSTTWWTSSTKRPRTQSWHGAGLRDEEDVFAGVVQRHGAGACVARHQPVHRLPRSLWCSLFEGTIEKVVALAVLMPIVASMGGIAGTQTVTLIIRGLALGQVSGATRAGCWQGVGRRRR